MAVNKNKINDNALRYIQRGQFKKAIKEYDKILAEDPNDVRTLLKKGDLLVKVGARAEAIDAYLKVADTYSRQGFHLKAVAVFKQILKIDSSRIDVNLRLAEEYQQLGIVGDAMSHLQVVASYYEQQGMASELMDILRRITELDPENIPTLIRLAEMYSRQGLVAEAVETFTQAAERLKAANRIEDYIKVVERIIYHDNSNLELVKELANIYLQRGDTKRALGKLQICFKADPQDLEVLSMLAQAFQDLNQIPKTVSVYKEMARIHKEREELDQAKQMWQKVIALMPDDVEARNALAELEPAEQADFDLEEVIELDDGEGVPTQFDLEDEIPTKFEQPPELASDAEIEAEEIQTEIPEFEDDVAGDEMIVVEAGPAEKPEATGGQIGDAAVKEEISKLLTETAVYIKYGLTSKAYEHLTRVFELDPTNIEAHEKLKEIYLQANQLDHAAQELVTLVQLTMQAGDHDRARANLRALLAIKPDHPSARALAEQLGEDMDQLEQPQDADEIELVEEVNIEIENDAVDEEEPTRMAEIGDLGNGVNANVPALDFSEDEQTLDISRATTTEVARSSEQDLPDQAGVPEPEEFSVPDVIALEPPEDVEAGEPAEELLELDEDDEQLFDQVGQAGETKEFDASAELAEEFLEPNSEAPEPEAEEPPMVEVETVENGTVDGQVTSTEEITAPLKPVEQEEQATGLQEPEGSEAEESELEDALDELDFYLQQKLVEEASEELERLEQQYPGHPELARRRQQLEQLAGGEQQQQQQVQEGEQFDLASEIEEELDEDFSGAPLDEDFQYSFEDVFSEFKKGVEKVLGKEDAATHYDLGIAYKEMGLVDDAIGEFELAAQDEKKFIAAMSMIGICLKEKGQYSEAINRFKDALHGPNLTDKEATGIYYELGDAYEKLGDKQEALFYYQKVFKRDSGFRDVAERIDKLGGDTGSISGKGDKNSGGSKPVNSKNRSKNNISYM